MKSHRYLWLGTAVLGFVAGALAREWGGYFQGSPGESPAPATGESRDVSLSSSADQARAAPEVSRDRLEDLLAIQDNAELYRRLAVWMTQASEEDCIALFHAERGRKPRDLEMMRLILSRWTSLDPMAAMIATKESEFSAVCWMAWAANDPKAVFAYGRQAGPKTTSNALTYIALTNPVWAQRLIAENPDLDPQGPMHSIIQGLSWDDPEASLELSRKHDIAVESAAIAQLTRRDPQAALAWLLENPGMARKGPTETFIKTLVQSSPQDLDGLLAGIHSGSLKRGLEKAKFQTLADTDPEKALQMARETEAPAIATERLSEAGSRLARKDPVAALGVLKEIFTRYPKEQAESNELLRQMVSADPESTMAAALESETTDLKGYRRPFRRTAMAWSAEDPDAFGAWLEDQDPGEVRQSGAEILSTRLLQKKRFPEALQWATEAAGSESRQNGIESIFVAWIKDDPVSARRWIEEGNAPPPYQERLANKLPEP